MKYQASFFSELKKNQNVVVISTIRVNIGHQEEGHYLLQTDYANRCLCKEI